MQNRFINYLIIYRGDGEFYPPLVIFQGTSLPSSWGGVCHDLPQVGVNKTGHLISLVNGTIVPEVLA